MGIFGIKLNYHFSCKLLKINFNFKVYFLFCFLKVSTCYSQMKIYVSGLNLLVFNFTFKRLLQFVLHILYLFKCDSL